MKVLLRLGAQIDRQLPPGLDVLPRVDVDLGLAIRREVRVPDLVVLPTNLMRRGPNRASEIVLTIEILTPGLRDQDIIDTRVEYADAGIPSLWIVNPRTPVTATVYGLYCGDFEEDQRCERTLKVDKPCRLTIDLDTLLPC